MAKRRTSLASEAVRTYIRRKDRASILKDFNDNGWEILDDTRTVTRKGDESEFSASPVHIIPRLASKYDIFFRLLPLEFALDVLLERAHDRDGGLTFHKGNQNYWTVEATEDLAMKIIAIRLQVHANMNSNCG